MNTASTLNKNQLHMTKQLNGKRGTVYRAWTDPAELAKWFGPEEAQIKLAETDLKVNGKYRITMEGPTGDQFTVSGVYREIVEDEKLVFTWKWEFEPEDVPPSLVTIQLRDAGNGTEMSLTHNQFVDEDHMGKHNEGWESSFACLAKYLDS
jgi:uncharacterized protein YndB with AHSA1/START domain